MDWTFGLKDTLPGITNLMTIQGPIDFTRGFVNGTNMLKNEDTRMCDYLLGDDIIQDGEQLVNISSSILVEYDFYKILYLLFDDLLVVTRIT